MQNYKTPIAISGTHGKTTTTSMVSEILLHAGTDPTLSIGGMLKSIGGNIRVGSTDLFVTEACEYTNSFLSFFPRIGMILNIEEDHLDFFKDLEDIRNSFHKFAKLLPADGCLIINGAIDRLQEITGDLDCRVITFNKEAVNSDGSAADYYPSDITYDEFGHPSFTLHRHGEVSGSFSLQVPGEHNVCNAIASIALADLLKIDREVTASALPVSPVQTADSNTRAPSAVSPLWMIMHIIPPRLQPPCMRQRIIPTRPSGVSSSHILTPEPRHS